jgi:hypothetical protein
MVTPAVVAANLESSDAGIWVRVTNLSGGTTEIDVFITRRLLVQGMAF